MSMKKSNGTTGNRTCDLPACSAVPQPTAPHHVPVSTFRRTTRKPGIGLCLRFVVPEQNQVQACVYVSSYQNARQNHEVQTANSSVYNTEKSSIHYYSNTRSAVFWVTTSCSLVGTYQSSLEKFCSHVQVLSY